MGLRTFLTPAMAPAAQVRAIHDRRIHFLNSFFCKHRTPCRIEKNIVFQNNDGGFNSIDGESAFFKNAITRIESFLESFQVGLLEFGT